ncbi:hypothetical protein EI427_21920 [Flammeovirga pectinis]|uniref:Cadherin domain-containing protein n=1 Tax=Flammeovirga pectinis TaxID=2494373 RepID=A0A3S9P9K8_9BACT|nr:hypothetical protein [Flammeovirga pectinis]AZQ64886.1 hypothetical protein EI427_21920 [Flammeovirga pectinis]
MKNIYIYSFLAFILAFTSCTKEQEIIEGVESDIANPPQEVSYQELITSYSDTIITEKPSISGGTTNVAYGIEYPVRVFIGGEEVDYATTSIVDSAMVQFLFTTDAKTGEVIIRDTPNFSVTDLPYGDYVVSVYTDYRGGTVVHDSASTIHLVNLGLELEQPSYTNAVNTSFTGVYETVKAIVTDLETSDLEILSYALINDPVEGFSIDSLTGELSKESVLIAPGTYQFGVKVNTTYGDKYFDSTLITTVNPLDIAMTYTSKNVGFLETGSIGTPSLSGSELDAAEASSFRYSFTEEYVGFTIDSLTGEIFRPNLVAAETSYSLEVALVTNIGVVPNTTLEITIAEKPAMTFAKDGVPTTSVEVSPWTAFTGLQVNLEQLGNEAQTYSIISDLEGLTINTTTGAIALAADQNYTDGEYAVTVVANSPGNDPLPYADAYTIKVVTKEFVTETITGGYQEIVDIDPPFNGMVGRVFDDMLIPTWAAPTVIGAHADHPTSIPWIKSVQGAGATFSTGIYGVVLEVPLAGAHGEIKSLEVKYKDGLNNSHGWGAGSKFNRSFRVSDAYTTSSFVASEWTTLEEENNGTWTTGYGATNMSSNEYVLPTEELDEISYSREITEGETGSLFFGIFVEVIETTWGNTFAIVDLKYSTIEVYDAIFE